MSLLEIIIFFLVVWWPVFFMLLPIGFEQIAENKNNSFAKSAPKRPNVLKKFIFTTIFSAIITLIFSLLGYAVIPYGPGLSIGDLTLGILYMLAVSSLSTYGILLAG